MAVIFFLNLVNRFAQLRELPHLLFYGPAGTGKTSCAIALAASFFPSSSEKSTKPYRCTSVLELNASDDRGIETVREQIKSFASTKAFFEAVNVNDFDFKIIILDEVDSMTGVAQNALRRSTSHRMNISNGKVHKECSVYFNKQLHRTHYSSLAIKMY